MMTVERANVFTANDLQIPIRARNGLKSQAIFCRNHATDGRSVTIIWV
jgi:hypothetical protein